jgi:acetylornithine deacetylase/succinyl-diaminopimelate desuccinylase-like protein
VVPTLRGCAPAYGPGDSLLDHTAEEHISLEEFLLAVGVMKQVLIETTKAGVNETVVRGQ